ncbi:MAG: hypothetical protein ABEJ78_09215 [Haloferacaceae archaeon]
MGRRARLRTLAVALGVGAGAIGLAHGRVPDDVPFSPVVARGRVGADFVERTGLAVEGTVRGEMDDLSAYARPGFDPGDVRALVRHVDGATRDDDTVLARHAMWALGRRFLTVDYVAGRGSLSISRHNGKI